MPEEYVNGDQSMVLNKESNPLKHPAIQMLEQDTEIIKKLYLEIETLSAKIDRLNQELNTSKIDTRRAIVLKDKSVAQGEAYIEIIDKLIEGLKQ